MSVIHHGAILPAEPTTDAASSFKPDDCQPPFWRYGYMFDDLQARDECFLVPGQVTVDRLRALGLGMRDPTEEIDDALLPVIYTFFGQFVDHDITLMGVRKGGSASMSLSNPSPMDPEQVTWDIVNYRSANLDLDNVYGPSADCKFPPLDPADKNKLLLEHVGESQLGPVVDDSHRDLPRQDEKTAKIGDKRDDENLVISQLHVAFLRAHNAIVANHKLDFEGARKMLVQHYQWIVLDDFLERIADPNIVKRVRYQGHRHFDPPAESFFMPLEFSVAAFRFGHSKVRPFYRKFNAVNEGGLDLLFSNAGKRLTEDWVIDWNSFLRPEINSPRPIDTVITPLLLDLGPGQTGDSDPDRNLAVRNLLRGYILRMPTGQAAAETMAADGIKPLTPEEIESVVERISEEQSKSPHVSHLQIDAVKNTDFLKKTPLWFYILAEAAFHNQGSHLGPVGSTIVAEVLIAILRNSTDSILSDPSWKGPTLGATPGKFDIEDLLKLAGVF